MRHLKLAAAALLIAGCQEQKAVDLGPLEDKVEALKLEVATVRLEQLALENQQRYREWETIAFLRPADDGWSPIRFSLGTLTAKIEDVKPYANGSKVTLLFGNPLASSITGLEAKVDWGEVSADGLANNETAKTKTVTFTETIVSGRWNKAPIVLEGIPPAQLGFVRISNVKFSAILLQGK